MSLFKKKTVKKNDETHSILSSIEYFILIFKKKYELKFSAKMNLYE